MGTWPDWTTSWHASARLTVYKGGDYLGDGLFQTFKRKMQSDGSSSVDYRQVARHALARPQTWNAGNDVAMRVADLWASQNLTDSSSKYAKEWMSNLTSPKEGFSNCSDGVISRRSDLIHPAELQ